MKKSINGILYLSLCVVIVFFLTALFYLTQRNYVLLRRSNEAVIETAKLISVHQRLSNDFKNLIIYSPSFKNNVSKQYSKKYKDGTYQIYSDLINLKLLVDSSERTKLTQVSIEISTEENWMMNKDIIDTLLYGQKNNHVKSIIFILNFIDKEPLRLEQISLYQVKKAEQSLIVLHNWLLVIIVCSSFIILFTLIFIFFQIRRVRKQNKSLMEIAWIQSHKVRSQVATILGLGQLFNHRDSFDLGNSEIIKGIVFTTEKLDEIVKEINQKTVTSY